MVREWASFCDELAKIAGIKPGSNVVNLAKSVVGGKGGNVVAKPLPSSGIKAPTTTLKPASKPTNYSMVHSNAPTAAYGAATGTKAVPPPPVRT